MPPRVSKPELYKTQLCKWWLADGTCAHGDACRFAHGDNDLKPGLMVSLQVDTLVMLAVRSKRGGERLEASVELWPANSLSSRRRI